MRRLLQRSLLPVLLVLAGCLTVDNEGGPVLAIELLWDAQPEDDSFAASDCTGAGVEMMEWALYDDDGDEVASNTEPCADAIDVFEPDPGEYELDVTGFDENAEPLWSVTCRGLRILRFDVAFECDILGG